LIGAYFIPSNVLGFMSPKTNNLFLKIALGMVVVSLALAVLIPNLLRSRMTADPATPAAAARMTVNSINLAEITYATNYEKIGYAPTLAVLGPAGAGECSPEHACLLDAKLACSEGSGQGWCAYDGYRFNIQTSSSEPPYKEYWVTATPMQVSPKLRNYCSTSIDDAAIHMESAAPLRCPYTREECLALPTDANGYHPFVSTPHPLSAILTITH
jgi:hypothetical protein